MDQTAIYNLALSACGSVATVSSPTERSREAALCNQWYAVVRDNVLAAAPWPSVRKFSRLARIAELGAGPWTEASPDPEFSFAYAVPADLIRPYHMQSFRPFTYGLIGAARCLSSNEEAPILYYNSRQENPQDWEQALQMAVIYSLAFHLARPLTGRNSTQQANATLAESFVEQAATAAANQHEEEKNFLPDWLQARGYSVSNTEKWFYPMASLNLNLVP